MTTTAPQPVSSRTVETPSQTSSTPAPGSHPGPGRKVVAGLAATLIVAGGIGAYFAVNTTSAPTPSKQTVTSGGVDVIERSGISQPVTSGGVDVIERQGCSARCLAAQARLESHTK